MIKKFKGIFLCCILVLQMGIFFPVVAMANQSVGEMVAELQSNINDNDINQLVNKFHSLKLTIAVNSQLSLIRQNLTYMANGLANQSLSNISPQQQRFLTNTRKMVTQIKTSDSSELKTPAKIRAYITDMKQALKALPEGDKYPIVASYSQYGVITNTAENFKVYLEGALLGDTAAKLVFAESECERNSQTERSIDFICPASVLAKATNLATTIGRLTVYGKQGFWARLFSLDPNERSYDLPLISVPSFFGVVEGYAMIETTKQEAKNHRQRYAFANQHCGEERTVCDTFKSSGGKWMIDADSIVDSCQSSKNSHCLGIDNIDDSSFQVCGAVANEGYCVRTGGITLATDRPGSVRGRVKWQEVRQHKTRTRQTMDEKKLQWQTHQVVQLPNNTAGFQLKVSLLGGLKTVLVDKTGDFGWFTVARNDDQLIVRVKN